MARSVAGFGSHAYLAAWTSAHAFRNTGNAVLRYLAFGAPAETVDTLDYPDTDVRVELTRYGKLHAFRLPQERHLPYWHGVPTD